MKTDSQRVASNRNAQILNLGAAHKDALIRLATYNTYQSWTTTLASKFGHHQWQPAPQPGLRSAGLCASLFEVPL